MGTFWRKPLFWIIFFLILLTVIPVSFYFFKNTITSLLPSDVKTQTQTPAEPKAGSCLIFEEQYCSKGQLVETTNKQGRPEIYIGFNLPPDVPIFSWMDGQTLKGKINQPDSLEGLTLFIVDPKSNNTTNPVIDIKGDIRFEDMISYNVKTGVIVAYTQNTGIKNLGNYNILIGFRQLDTKLGYPVPAEETLRKLFPYIVK